MRGRRNFEIGLLKSYKTFGYLTCSVQSKKNSTRHPISHNSFMICFVSFVKYSTCAYAISFLNRTSYNKILNAVLMESQERTKKKIRNIFLKVLLAIKNRRIIFFGLGSVSRTVYSFQGPPSPNPAHATAMPFGSCLLDVKKKICSSGMS